MASPESAIINARECLKRPFEGGLKTQLVEYRDQGIVLEGFMAYEAKMSAQRSGALVFPQFKGVSDHEKRIAERLAGLGYVAFVGDIYGRGVFHADRRRAANEAAIYFNNRALVRTRVLAALEEIRRHPSVDGHRVAAIGYCFGGMAALELARAGGDVLGVVTFHGDLATPTPEDARNIKGRVLALHGADDIIVTPDEVAAFEREMRGANIDWQLISYGGAVHAFTAEDDPTASRQRVAYNEKADRRSWIAMMDFLEELFVP
jgi:dienelactone hydrolase